MHGGRVGGHGGGVGGGSRESNEEIENWQASWNQGALLSLAHEANRAPFLAQQVMLQPSLPPPPPPPTVASVRASRASFRSSAPTATETPPRGAAKLESTKERRDSSFWLASFFGRGKRESESTIGANSAAEQIKRQNSLVRGRNAFGNTSFPGVARPLETTHDVDRRLREEQRNRQTPEQLKRKLSKNMQRRIDRLEQRQVREHQRQEQQLQQQQQQQEQKSSNTTCEGDASPLSANTTCGKTAVLRTMMAARRNSERDKANLEQLAFFAEKEIRGQGQESQPQHKSIPPSSPNCAVDRSDLDDNSKEIN